MNCISKLCDWAARLVFVRVHVCVLQLGEGWREGAREREKEPDSREETKIQMQRETDAEIGLYLQKYKLYTRHINMKKTK